MKAFSNIEELTKSTFFTDLIEAVQNSYGSYENDDEEYYDDYYYDYESPAQSVANQVSASLLDFNPALRSASKGSAGCSTAKLSRKSPLGWFSIQNVLFALKNLIMRVKQFWKLKIKATLKSLKTRLTLILGLENETNVTSNILLRLLTSGRN